ncbi:thiol reductant ABC exporter subunit CydC [Enterococcus sp. BWT-B8]|uniref:thiol reductant ABC exporter subunit CydC n=1 Tax=Enterococcus sp. BWT-B8 TaxID=2885157 RepID=UPI001E62E112|nr:thiol reductant ABC exporter subunit CydC [Enterococcus sp. BWT-B8]MCB5951959.1 thiol reductant ABC exporter subunit CydC [Enterococcus sp. BWT-B8]
MKLSMTDNGQQDQWVRPFLKKYKGLLMLAIFLGFLTFFSAGALMFNSGYLISRAASLPENILLIYIPIVLTRAFGISRPVFRYVERLVSHNWVLKMTSDLRLKLYRILEKDAMFLKSNYQTGDILGLLSEDINHLQNLYLRTIFPMIIAGLLYVVIVIGLGFFSWWFALCMLLLLGVTVVLLPILSVLVNGARQERQKGTKNQLYKILTDNILGVSDWVFSQRGSEFVLSYEEKEKELREIDREIKRFDRRRDVVFQLFFGMIALAVLIWAGTRFPGNHGGAANWIAAFVLTVFPLIDAFAPLSDAAQETTIYKDSISRLNELPEVEGAKEAAASNPNSTKIEARQLTFTYQNASRTVLSNLSLEIPEKEKLAILGRSGSGKSTLASLIRGDLQPTQGEMLIGGVPADQLGDSITEYIGVIQQKPYLFHTTILNNLRIGKESASEEEVWHVLELVGLKKMVQQLPDGLQTMVDEAGLRFSGGERHRLALARILLQDTPVVLLDEPTTGLDPITEQKLLTTFFDVLEDKTIIWITHHLQSVQKMDRIIFIEDGQLMMSGTPEELMTGNRHFQMLYRIDQGLN